MINIRYTTPVPHPDLRRPIAELAARLAADLLGKDPGVTAALVETADPDSWFVAGEPLARTGLSAFWLEIRITAGTNTKPETAAFVKAAYDGMAALLGPLHPECYVHVHAVDGDSYGYGGRTQNARWAEAHPG
ncbi:hypothetical protein [Xanthomonas massiliensis]|uniref:hypothetical protein n=1 Tax=Xanthomonas massiliensis TaxID=1720302 RepID=UPI001919EF42|nr:hypothetical protein [Xanthomonas massiliensis]